MTYKKFALTVRNEYMFCDSYTVEENNMLRLVCPNTGGGNLGGWRGCRTAAGVLAHPDFQPKAIIFNIGTVGSYGRGLYWCHRFDTDQSDFYVRDVTASGKPREYSRKQKRPDGEKRWGHDPHAIYNTVIFLVPIEVEGLSWEPPSLL